MEIHSSSLASIPAGYKPNDKNEQTQYATARKEKNTEPNSLSTSLDTSKVDKTIDAPTLELISEKIVQQNKGPSNSRAASAISAYEQENTQALKIQRSELVSGIDLFA